MDDWQALFGTESGSSIVRPHADRAEILSEVELPKSMDDNAGQCGGIAGSGGLAARRSSRGRVFFASTGGIYARSAEAAKARRASPSRGGRRRRRRRHAWQVSPTELVLKPGQTVKLGRGCSTPKDGSCAKSRRPPGVAGLKGTIAAVPLWWPGIRWNRPARSRRRSARYRRGARARRAAAAWSETFDAYAEGAGPPAGSRHRRHSSPCVTPMARKCGTKAADQYVFKRVRRVIGPTEWSN